MNAAMDVLARLREKGLILARNPPRLDPASRFELPCVIQADLAPMNRITVGAFTGIDGGRLGHCSIGRYCSIAPGVDIASDQHPTDWFSTSMIQYVSNVHGWGDWLLAQGEAYCEPVVSFNSNSPVEIANDVWIGKNAIVKSGVKIGNGAIVAAGAVVVRDVPPYAIVAGVPGVIKRFRFSNEVIDRLLRLEWWRYNIMGVRGLDPRNVEDVLDRLEGMIGEGNLTPFQGIELAAREFQTP